MNNLSTPVRILITNIVTLNTGDAAILLGTIDILKNKYGTDTKITVFDKHSSIAKKYYQWAVFRQSLFHRPYESVISQLISKHGYGHLLQKLAFKKYRLLALLIRINLTWLANSIATRDVIADIQEYVNADLIISSGGTYLIENYDLLSAIHEYHFSLALGKKLGFFTMSLGPYTAELNKLHFTRIFNDSTFILLRDERSRNHLSDIGVNLSRVHLCADAAFTLASRTPPKRKIKNDTPRIAISVRSMNFFHEDSDHHHLNYSEIILTAIQVAIEEFGADVTFLSTCQGITEYWTNDAVTAREIYGMIPSHLQSKVAVDSNFRQPGEIVDTYKDFDAVIATRMHSAILSICACTPVVGIAYEFKMEELFRKIGIQQLCISIGRASKQDVTQTIRQILKNNSNFHENTAVAAALMREDALTAISHLPCIEHNHTK